MYKHPVATDQLLRRTVYRAETWLKRTQFLPDTSERKSLLDMSIRYAHWLSTLGVGKKYVKWVLPITTSSEPKNKAQKVFGKDPSPISKLGDRPVAAYIRFLLFKRGWSVDAVTQHLVSEHGYDYKSARPAICRMMRNEKQSREQFSKESLFEDVIYA